MNICLLTWNAQREKNAKFVNMLHISKQTGWPNHKSKLNHKSQTIQKAAKDIKDIKDTKVQEAVKRDMQICREDIKCRIKPHVQAT